MESINYTPSKPTEKPGAYNKVIVTWNHGFQHSFVSVGHTLRGQLKAVEELDYVKEVIHYEITREEYDSFYSTTLDDVEATVDKKSGTKKVGLKFSSLENFFGDENTVEKKVPVKKSRRK